MNLFILVLCDVYGVLIGVNCVLCVCIDDGFVFVVVVLCLGGMSCVCVLL